ncbi:MAG: AAA family ATPase, partial [Chloroflexi bacterium]|nr:AAA family ATPase [Chloroflexota bacterium]
MTHDQHFTTIVSIMLTLPADAPVHRDTLTRLRASIEEIARQHGAGVMPEPAFSSVVFRGAAAAVQAIQAAEELLDQWRDSPFKLRAGVASGEVALYRAPALARAADTGQIWVSTSVQRAAAHTFDFAPVMSPHRDTWRVVGTLDTPPVARGIPYLQPKLIGRRDTLEQMLAFSERLDQGIGGIMMIEGEPGIGKTRLIAEFLEAIGEMGAQVWQTSAKKHLANQSFALFNDLLRHVLHVETDDPPELIRGKLQASLGTSEQVREFLQSYLELVIGIQPGDPAEGGAGQLEPTQLRQQIFVAFRHYLQVAAAENRLIIVLDDLHWSDPISAEMLAFLFGLIASAPVLFVCAQRPQQGHPPSDRINQSLQVLEAQSLHLTLTRLSRQESEALVESMLAQPEIVAELSSTVIERAQGNPYFIEEFVRLLIEQGLLVSEEDRWVYHPASGHTVDLLPASLETLIRSRINSLPPDQRELLRRAAVFGSPFPEEFLAPFDPQQLNQLAARQLIARTGAQGEWTFLHSLVEWIVYKTIPDGEKVTRHTAAAEFLAQQIERSQNQPGRLATHYLRAQQPAEAFDYLLTAGEQAGLQGALQEARTFFEQAQRLVDSPDITLDDRQRLRLKLNLGDIIRLEGDLDTAIASLTEARALAVKLGDLSAAARCSRLLGETARKQGDMSLANKWLTEANTLLEQASLPEPAVERAKIQMGQAWVAFQQGDLQEAEHFCKQSLTDARSAKSLLDMA